MRLDLQADLFCRFPLALRPGARSAQPAPIDEWGVQCGDGWRAPIESALAILERHCEQLRAAGKTPRSWPRVVQIKEKFGRLVIYADHAKHLSDADNRALDAAMLSADALCESCGAPGVQRNSKGYLRIACATCFAAPQPEINAAAFEAELAALRSILAARRGGPAAISAALEALRAQR